MYKIAAIIGGVLLMAGVAMAGTMTSLGSASTPNIGQTIPTASVTVQREDRGREAEARGRANEPGEDVRREDRAVTAEPGDDRGRDRNRGSESHGRHRGGDDRNHSGHGGHGGDD
jgi:hypothetical protein